jgi:hypothetical protein
VGVSNRRLERVAQRREASSSVNIVKVIQSGGMEKLCSTYRSAEKRVMKCQTGEPEGNT